MASDFRVKKCRMTIRLVCHGGKEVKFVKDFSEKLSLFKQHPGLLKARSYKLECKPSTAIVELFLKRVYDESSHVVITEDNFHSLRNLSLELGFSGLDAELQAFEMNRKTLEERLNDVLQQNAEILKLLSGLEQRVQRLEELVIDPKHNKPDIGESMIHRVESLERKVEEVERMCEKRSQETSKRIDQAIYECANVVDFVRDSDGKGKITASRWEFAFENSPFKGIMAYLRKICEGNPMTEGIVNVTCSSEVTNGRLENLFDYGWSDFVSTRDIPGSWYCIDMIDYRVMLTAYTLKSRNGWNNNDPVNWVVEGSVDNREWTILDSRTTDVMKESSAVHTFELSIGELDLYRYIRFKQRGPNSGGNNFFNLSSIELFGRLFQQPAELPTGME